MEPHQSIVIRAGRGLLHGRLGDHQATLLALAVNVDHAQHIGACRRTQSVGSIVRLGHAVSARQVQHADLVH